MRVAYPILLSGFLLAVPSLAAAYPEPAARPQQETVPPPLSSPWRTWQFNASREKVLAEILAMMREDSLTPGEESKESGILRTDMVEFNDKKFGVDVSIPPQKASPKYPFFQTNTMTSGRFGMECRLSRVNPSLTRVDLRAVLEIRAMDQKQRAMRWVPRYSNGEVERNYFTRLSLRLLVPPPAASPP